MSGEIQDEVPFAAWNSGVQMEIPEAPLTEVTPNMIRSAPFRWVCAIEVNHGKRILPVAAQTPNADLRKDMTGPRVGGSGLLISRRHVLTCGHLFANRLDANHSAKEIIVHFGNVAGPGVVRQAAFGSWVAKRAWFPPRLLASNAWESRSFDFGLIELHSNNGEFPGDKIIDNPREQFGWWGKSGPNYFMNTQRPPGWLNSRKVNVYGFPNVSDKLHHGFGEVTAVLERDKTLGRLQPLIHYDVKTGGGTSGGPVWTTDKSPLERRLVAIHSGDANGRGYALVLNPVLAAFLRKYGVVNHALDAADNPF